MGCDIHLYVERRTEDGKWVHLPDPVDLEGDDYSQERWADPRRWYHGRNYSLFAILADVRNGRGVAGVHTGDGFNPIADPRGLPDDVSPEVRSHSDEWDCDGHSHSWLTVREILSFDWDQETRLTGLFNDYGRDFGEPVKPRYKDGGFAAAVQAYADTYKDLPPWAGSYSSAVYGAIENEYKRVTWTTPYYQTVSNDWWASVARAARLAVDDMSSVRFVFWFDN